MGAIIKAVSMPSTHFKLFSFMERTFKEVGIDIFKVFES